MHRGDAEVREDEIGAGAADFGEGGGESGEVRFDDGELVGAEAGGAEAIFGAG